MTTVKEDIRKDLLKQLAQAKIVDITNAFTDAVSSGASLAEVAKKTGMHFGHIPAVDAQGLAPDGSRATPPAGRRISSDRFSRPTSARPAIRSR